MNTSKIHTADYLASVYAHKVIFYMKNGVSEETASEKAHKHIKETFGEKANDVLIVFHNQNLFRLKLIVNAKYNKINHN